MAGVLDALPFANRSDTATPTLFDRYVAPAAGGFPVMHSLVGQFDGSVTGSVKNDAYRWAADNLLTNATFGRRANPAVQGYMIDYYWTRVSGQAPIIGNTVPNQDYVMAQRGFLWDLDVWADEAPCVEFEGKEKFEKKLESSRKLKPSSRGTHITLIQCHSPWRHFLIPPLSSHPFQNRTGTMTRTNRWAQTAPRWFTFCLQRTTPHWPT